MKKRLMIAGLAAIAASAGYAAPARAECVPAAGYRVCAFHEYSFGYVSGYAVVGVFFPPDPEFPGDDPLLTVGEWSYGDDRTGLAIWPTGSSVYVYSSGSRKLGVGVDGPAEQRVTTPLPALGPMPRP